MGAGIEKGIRSYWRIKSLPVRIFLAEFLATLVMVSFGCGGVAQYILSEGVAGSPITTYLGWGLGYTFGHYLAGKVSGGHMNPAVTLAFCILGRTRWVFFFLYICAQFLGAFTGAAFVYGMYIDAFNTFHNYGPKSMATASIFATYPQTWLTTGNAILDTMYGTALLMMLWLAVTDENNMGPSKGLVPITIGLIVSTIGMTFGYNCQFALNPARDLAPRLFSLFADWPDDVFEIRDHDWWWIPFVMPYVGTFIGCLMYMIFVGAHIPPAEETDMDDDDDEERSEDWGRKPRKSRKPAVVEDDADSYRRRSRQEYPHPDHSQGYQPDQVGPQNGPLSNRQPTLPRASYRNNAYEPDRPTMYYGNNDQQRY